MTYKKMLFEIDEAGAIVYLNKTVRTLSFQRHLLTLEDLFHSDMPAKVLEQIRQSLKNAAPWKNFIMLSPNEAGIEWAEFFITRKAGGGCTGYIRPTDAGSLLHVKMQFSSLKFHERAGRISSHIEIENLALRQV